MDHLLISMDSTVAQMSIEFDIGYYYHFIFVLDALVDFDEDWFQGFIASGDNLVEFIDSELNNFQNHIANKGSDTKGCTFIVPCGFGRGFSVGFSPQNEDWLVEIINANDFITLSQDFDCNPFRIWRLIEAQQIAKKFGAKIFNLNGFLNLYGYIKQNNFSLFNHSDFLDIDSETIHVTVGTNFQKEVRQRVLQDIDEKIVHHPNDGLTRVRRGFANSFFKQNDAYNVYCPVELDLHLLQAVLCEQNLELWVEMSIVDTIETSLQSQIFRAYIHWLPRVVHVLTQVGVDIQTIRLIRLDIDFPEVHKSNRASLKEMQVFNSCEYWIDENILECQFDENLVSGFNLSTNCAEQALVKPLISVAIKGLGLDYKDVLKEVFDSPYARHVNFFQCETYSENIVGSFEHDDPIVLEIAADNNNRFGLGWLNGGRSPNNHIIGKADCKKHLGSVVSNVWDKAQNKLKTLNKKGIVEVLLHNIELCELHKTRWTKTFKANYHLQQDLDDLYQVATKEVGLLTGATLASRLLIEMATCECSEGGKMPGKMDIQELQSYAMSLHLLGGVSDAINYDAIRAELYISHFGDVLYDHDFEDLILNNYQLGLHKNKFDSAAKNYDKEPLSLKPQTSEKDVEDAFEGVFWNSWIDEFGFNINEGIDFINAIQTHGYELDKLVFTLNKEELLSLAPEIEISKRVSIVDCLTYESRSSWVKIPEPFKPTDWQPWKFKRRYSLAFKPIVYIQEQNIYILSPEHIRRGFYHLLTNTYDATIDESHFHHKSMIAWNGSKRASTGLKFNTAVAETFDKENWFTEEEVKLTKILNKKLKDFGDIDVLAWHKTKNLVLAIECKDLEMAKNQSEIARQLYEFKGQVNKKGKSDRLHKHILRLQELNKDPEGVAKYIDKSQFCDLTVIGLVVFSSLVPMNFVDLKGIDIAFTHIDELQTYLEGVE